MTEIDEKMAFLGEFRAFLLKELEEAKAAIDYYSAASTNEWEHKALASKWKERKEELQRQLNIERIIPEEFQWLAELHHRRNSFKLD